MKRFAVRRPAGGWLVTYADLMTILVCFFVLIISYSIQDQVKMEVVAGSMRDAFGVAEQRRFAGDVKLQGTPEKRQPGNIRPSEQPTANGVAETLTARPAAGSEGRYGAFESPGASNSGALKEAAAAFEKAILTHPLLKDQAEAVTISLDDQGLQVVIVDQSGAPMFEIGAATPTAPAEMLLSELADVLIPLPNEIAIEGHADATGTGAYSPFELTAARANAARAIIEQRGFPTDRISAVSGRGAAKPLYPENPYADANRRVEILVLPAAPLLPPERSL